MTLNYPWSGTFHFTIGDNMKEHIRTCRFIPYKDGAKFTLQMYDIGRVDALGKSCVGYRLTMKDGNNKIVLFEGEDFYCSPMHAIDSDACVNSLMSFLTLRPGDTDSEYFESYTDEQLAYCDTHAENLSYEVMNRFGDI